MDLSRVEVLPGYEEDEIEKRYYIQIRVPLVGHDGVRVIVPLCEELTEPDLKERTALIASSLTDALLTLQYIYENPEEAERYGVIERGHGALIRKLRNAEKQT